jgi:hypothetical protein
MAAEAGAPITSGAAIRAAATVAFENASFIIQLQAGFVIS